MIEDLTDITGMRSALEHAAEAMGNSRLDGKPGLSPAGLLAHHVFRYACLVELSGEDRMTALAYLVCTRLERDMDVISWLESEAKADLRRVPVVGMLDAH